MSNPNITTDQPQYILNKAFNPTAQALVVTEVDENGVPIGESSSVSINDGTTTTDKAKVADGRSTYGKGLYTLPGTYFASRTALTDGQTDFLKLDSAGDLQVDVNNTVTVNNPTAADLNVTEASASAIKTAVEKIDDAIAGSEMQVDVLTMPGTGVEDAGETAGGTLLMAGTVRRDTAASSAGTTGDNATLNTDATGNLWTRVGPELPAGTQAIGNVGMTPRTSGGLLIKNCTAGDGSTALTNSAQAIKASAGQLFGWYIFNPNTVTVWVCIYNTAAASVTVGTTNPAMVLGIPAGSAANVVNPMGIEFTNAGWSAAAVMTSAGGNTAPTTAVDANFFYI